MQTRFLLVINRRKKKDVIFRRGKYRSVNFKLFLAKRRIKDFEKDEELFRNDAFVDNSDLREITRKRIKLFETKIKLRR